MDEVDVWAPCESSVCVCTAVDIYLKLQAQCNQGQERTESQIDPRDAAVGRLGQRQTVCRSLIQASPH